MYFDKCLFPVTPEKISIKINGNNKTVNLINEGEINILKKAGLTDIEFEAEIPQVKHPYAVYKNGFKEAGYFFDIFEGLKTGKKTFQFIVCRKTPVGKKLLNTNMKVSLLWSSIFVTLVAKKYHESVTLPSGLRMVYDNH